MSTSSNGTMHRLGSQAPMDNARWGTGRVPMPAGRALPGNEVTVVAVRVPGR